MVKHEIKICERCQSSFECKVGDVANCQCSTVVVVEATHEFLAKTAYDCLCQNCLIAINNLVLQSQKEDFPNRPSQLKEGVHFYFEGGLFVFTEYYHLLRGNCCGSGCRHCAYNS